MATESVAGLFYLLKLLITLSEIQLLCPHCQKCCVKHMVIQPLNNFNSIIWLNKRLALTLTDSGTVNSVLATGQFTVTFEFQFITHSCYIVPVSHPNTVISEPHVTVTSRKLLFEYLTITVS